MRVGLASAVCEGRWRVRGCTCSEHGARPLPPSRFVPPVMGYPKKVGLKEADDLRIGLLDLSSTVIGDINLCGTSVPLSQPSLDRSTGMWSESSSARDG